MIPKVIHYCWFGRTPLPLYTKKYIQSWKQFCPDYKIIEWNESNFDINSHPFVKSAYGLKAWAFVSDYVRLKVVYDNGGIYLDTDVELLKNIDFLLENEFYIGVQQTGQLCTTGLGFGAAKFNPIVQKMITQYENMTFELEKKEQLACPYLNSRVLKEIGYIYSDKIVNIDGAIILPPKFLDPLAPGYTQNLLCEDTISIHHYSASWLPKSVRMRRYLFRAIGDERIHMIKKLLKKSI